jgi:hypothetical protein
MSLARPCGASDGSSSCRNSRHTAQPLHHVPGVQNWCAVAVAPSNPRRGLELMGNPAELDLLGCTRVLDFGMRN